MSLRGGAVLVLVAWWTLAPAPGVRAEGLADARVSLGGKEVSLLAPLAIWDPADNHVSVAFFSMPPGAETEAKARQAGQWDSVSTGPAIVIDLAFTPGSDTAMVEQLEECRVTARGFPRALALEGSAGDCHLVSVGGLLRPGVGLIGLVQGEGDGYSLRLPFSVWLAEAAAGGGRAAAPARAADPPLPPGTVAGTANWAGQQLTLTHGLAWWDAARGEVRVGLFDREPPPGILADLRQGSWGEGGPVVQLHLELAGGAPAAPASVGHCYVNASFAEGGSIGKNTDAAGCGLTELAGDVKPGGHVVASLEGEGDGPRDRPFSWLLRLHLPVAP